MNRARVMRTVVLPLVVALIATLGLYQLVSRQAGNTGPSSVETTSVVVAARAIPSHTLITADMVVVKQLPTTYLLPGAVLSADGCLGRVSLVSIASGEIVLASKITGLKPGSSGLSYVIPQGKRALTLQVDEIIGVAGFPQPGDKLDILVTYVSTASQEQRIRMLLEAIPVIAVVQSPSASETGTARDLKGYTSLTVEVTPEQAATIVLAESEGLLRMILRPALDTTMAGDFNISASFLQEPGNTLNPNAERRIGFEVRVLELDTAAMTQLGYNFYGPSIVQLSSAGVGAVNDIINRGLGKVLDRATFNTPNRTNVSYGLNGEATPPSSTEAGSGVPFGVNISATPAYYGQGYVNVDTRIQWRIVDIDAMRPPITTTVSAGAAGRCFPGEALMALGMIGLDELVPPNQTITSWVLPEGYVSPAVLAGERVLVVIVAPSF